MTVGVSAGIPGGTQGRDPRSPPIRPTLSMNNRIRQGDTMSSTTPDDRTIVQSLLALHHISPNPSEVDELVGRYSAARDMADSLYVMPGVRYEEPAITFDPRRV